MDTPKSGIISGWVAAIAVACIWGVTGVVAKPLSMAIDPITLVFFTYLTSVIGLSVVFAFTSRSKSLSKELGSSLRIEKKDILRIAFCGVVGQGAFALFNILSLSHIGVTENAVVQGMQPFATVFFGMMFMGFKMNKIQWGAFVASALCIIAMSLGPTNKVEGGIPMLGFALVTASMLSLAWTSHLRCSLAEKYGSVVAMFYQYLSVSIAGVIAAFTLNLDLSQIQIIFSNPKLTGLLIFLGMGIAGGSYLVQLYSFSKIGVEKASMTLNLMPLVGYIVAVLALGEQMALGKTIVVTLIVVALYIFNKYESKEADKVESTQLLNPQ